MNEEKKDKTAKRTEPEWKPDKTQILTIDESIRKKKEKNE